jgi:ABC-type oligopeptide transport system ATPase subunit
MSNRKVIGLVGKLQSGKTTVADIILDYYKKDYNIICKYSFADLLKTMILNAGICTAEELWEKKTEFSRLMLQKIGTEIIRKQVSDIFWVQKMSEKIAETFMGSPSENILIVIDDVRFLNEARLIKSGNRTIRGVSGYSLYDGTLIRITRPSLDQNKIENKHLSETEQDEILVDYEIINDGSLIFLKEKIVHILKSLETNS